jgi:MYXO-CTERM domain-containing protein
MSPRRIALLLAVLSAPAAFGAEVQIRNTNDAGKGFNDPTPTTPVGLNFGTTKGQQALIAFQFAASIWGATLKSAVPIVIDSAFLTVQEDSRLQCTTTSGVIGFARLASYSSDSAYPVPGAAYPVALANALLGKDLTPGDAHIVARFSASVGNQGCLDNQSWYYGLDARESPSQDDLVSVALHEFGHGLGFISFVDAPTGSFGSDPPAIFDFHTWDIAGSHTWQAETNAQRQSLATSVSGLGVDGPAVSVDIPRFLAFLPTLSVDVPGLPTTLPFTQAEFSAPFAGGGPVLPVQPPEGCTEFTGTGLVGKVALIERSIPDAGAFCRFWDKAQNAADAGAVGVILFNSLAGAPLVTPSGSPPLSIPVAFVSLETGTSIASQAAVATVTATFGASSQRGGVDPSGNRPLLYAPSTVVNASSVSHFDTTAYPPLLMEPRILHNFLHNLDLTPAVMADLGWSVVRGLSVAVVKALDQEISAGQDAVYLVTLVNRRPGAANDVTIDLALPPGATVTSTAGACTTGLLPCDLGTLATGDVKLTLVTVRVSSPVPNPFEVTARVTTSNGSGDDVLEATSSISPPRASGCSTAGGGRGVGVGLAALLAAVLLRRRRGIRR